MDVWTRTSTLYTISLFDNRMENDNVKKSTNCELFIKFVHACDVLCIRQLTIYVLHLCICTGQLNPVPAHPYIEVQGSNTFITFGFLFTILSPNQIQYYLVYRHTYCIKYCVYCNIAWAMCYPINYSKDHVPALVYHILGGRWVLG